MLAINSIITKPGTPVINLRIAELLFAIIQKCRNISPKIYIYKTVVTKQVGPNIYWILQAIEKVNLPILWPVYKTYQSNPELFY